VSHERNILQATSGAMGDAIARPIFPSRTVLIEGNSFKHFYYPHLGIIHGDSKSFCIGIASIIAKATGITSLTF
jgi:ribonuclease HII